MLSYCDSWGVPISSCVPNGYQVPLNFTQKCSKWEETVTRRKQINDQAARTTKNISFMVFLELFRTKIQNFSDDPIGKEWKFLQLEKLEWPFSEISDIRLLGKYFLYGFKSFFKYKITIFFRWTKLKIKKWRFEE